MKCFPEKLFKFISIIISNTLQVEISEKDIQNAFLPLHTIVFIVNQLIFFQNIKKIMK